MTASYRMHFGPVNHLRKSNTFLCFSPCAYLWKTGLALHMLLESCSWCFHPKVTSQVWTFFLLLKETNDWASLTLSSNTILILQPCNFYHMVVVKMGKKHLNSTMPLKATHYWHTASEVISGACSFSSDSYLNKEDKWMSCLWSHTWKAKCTPWIIWWVSFWNHYKHFEF